MDTTSKVNDSLGYAYRVTHRLRQRQSKMNKLWLYFCTFFGYIFGEFSQLDT